MKRVRITIEGETGNLEDIEERLFALRDLARKHRTTVDKLPALQDAIAGLTSSRRP